MAEKSKQILDSFKATNRKIKSYEEALAVLYWDLRTGAPRKGMEVRSEVIGELSANMFKLSTSQELGEWISELERKEVFTTLSEIDQRLVSESRKDYDRSVLIPPKLYQEYVVITSQTESKWEEAKEQNDYEGFRPYLEKVIQYTNQFIDHWGAGETRYDTLLEPYEPGMTVKELDRIFGGLREKLVPLSSSIAASPHQPDTSFLRQQFDIDAQKKFSIYILGQLGFDFEAGRLDESLHPFATGLNPGDVRITTRYLKDDVTSALFGTIHECGHAMYEQNIMDELTLTTLCTGTSMGIHESQSRFWENVIGRSRPFWDRYYPEFQSRFPELKNVSYDQFYRGNNVVTPSLIRIEADELTYNLHIIIRYEIEKMIFNEGLTAAELPEVWNELYQKYLGIQPTSYSDGVLQDVHWSGGAFGYFPSYSLGNMYAAQFTNTMEQQISGFWSLVQEGNLHPIRDWLTERIYKYGKMRTPSELVNNITGKALDPQYLVTYLQDKYKDIYKL